MKNKYLFNTVWVVVFIIHIVLFFWSIFIIGDLLHSIFPTMFEGALLVFTLFSIFSLVLTPETSWIAPLIWWKKKIDGNTVPKDIFNCLYREQDIIAFKRLLYFKESIENAKTLLELEEIDKRICQHNIFWQPKLLGGIYGLPVKPIKYWESHKDVPLGKNNFGIAEDSNIYDLIINQYKEYLCNKRI